MSENTACIMLLPKREDLQKGMTELKQVIVSMVIVLTAAGILTMLVLYSVSMIRTAERNFLTGEGVSVVSVIP